MKKGILTGLSFIFKILFVVVVFFFVRSQSVGLVYAQSAFRFGSMSDSHVETSNFTQTVSQVTSLSPNFVLFNGDLENDGVVNTQMDPMINVLVNGNLFNQTFLVRGNHDDHVSGSAALWESYFVGKYGSTRSLPSGVTNYVAIDSGSTYLTYSFDYENSRFIGLDSNTNGDPPTSAQLTFLDQRLTDAEGKGLTQAFIFVHPPEYCVESTHCSCQTTSGCGPSSSFISIINKHPIVSATFHGHEHILAWVHMNSTRVPGLTHEYEEFITSSAGEPYSFTPYPARMDYYNYSSSLKAFGIVDVNGSSFTVSLYHTGTVTPVWSQTFTKSGTTVTVTSGTTATLTPKPTNTPTPKPTSAITPTGSVSSGTRVLKYYGVDRVESMNDANYKVLADHEVKTIVQYLSISSQSAWRSLITLAEKYNIDIVIFPNQGGDVSGCGWETPFNSPVNGNYIGRVTAMMDFFDNVANWPGGKIRVIGMVSSHEPMWNQGSCHTTIADLSAIKTQLKAYVNRSDFKVWSYIDNISDIPNITDYSGPADYGKIMDVAATWQHCFGGAEGTCPGAKNKIINDRKLIHNAGLDGTVELVFLMQTFAQGSGYVMPTYDQLLSTSQDFLNTGALDGFIYYTWGACWYTTDLGCPSVGSPANSALWPIMNIIYDTYGNKTTSTPTLTPTSSPASTSTPTSILGDADGDGKVDGVDYIIWVNHYNQSLTGASNGDFNSDSRVDGVDYIIWANHYGQ